MTERTMIVVLAILGTALLLCLGLIGWLSYAAPARPIPDVLVALPTSIVTLIAGLLVPRARADTS